MFCSFLNVIVKIFFPALCNGAISNTEASLFFLPTQCGDLGVHDRFQFSAAMFSSTKQIVSVIIYTTVRNGMI